MPHTHILTAIAEPTTDLMVRVDLWTTGRRDDRGSDVLTYALAFLPEHDRVCFIEGSDLCPSPMIDPAGVDAVTALVGFFAAYAEYGPDSPESPDHLTPRQWDALQRYREELALCADDDAAAGLWEQYSSDTGKRTPLAN